MVDQVVIERRFRGPVDSANGGYACAMVAQAIEPGPAVEVTLRAPPPLDRPLAVEATDDGAVLRDGETLLAEGRAAPAPKEPPDPVSLEQAVEARSTSPMQHDHPFPTCFVCGPDPEGGLHVTLGPVAGRDVVAAPYESKPEHAGDDGTVRAELVWSVLDCPSGVAGMLRPEIGTSVLGRMTAMLEGPLEAGADYVAIGWPISHEGRKFQAGSAIFSEGGERLAFAETTWIELPEQPAS